MDKYKKLRNDFLKPSFRKKLVEELGSVCSNCGSDLDIEYHHIVPLVLGGTNRITNIAPLCYSCHKKAHGSSKINKLRNRSTGRKKNQPPEDYKFIINSYFYGDIGRKQCQKQLGMAEKSKLTDMWYYKEFTKEIGVKSHKNKIDLFNSNKCKNKSHKGEMVAYILFDDGTEFKKFLN